MTDAIPTSTSDVIVTHAELAAARAQLREAMTLLISQLGPSVDPVAARRILELTSPREEARP
jgi:hypothetical protein